MALILDAEHESGFTISQSYAVVNAVGGNKTQAVIEVKYYVSSALKEEGNPHFLLKNYNFVPSVDDDSPNFIKQGYEYIKTLPEFANAIDA